MTRQEFQDLLDRYFDKSVSKSEKQLIDSFYEKLQETEDSWGSFDERKREELRSQIYNAIQNKKSTLNRKKNKRSVNKYVYRVAASVLIILGSIALYFANPSVPATHYVTKSTKSGQKSTITLGDGSTVRLNSESSITYPYQFVENQRVIYLQGEAFFEVIKDKNRPFIVNAHDIQTTVLGTSFNIHAYDPSSVAVSLVSGKVKVNTLPSGNYDAGSSKEVMLSPGESAWYRSESRTIIAQPFNMKKIVSWKDGIIYIAEASHDQVFEQLAHWYGVEFRFVNRPSEQWSYSGEFKDMSLETVLNTIGFSENFKFQFLDEGIKIEFNNY